MTPERDNTGKFLKGNKAAQKPLKCPFCDKRLQLRTYAYLEPINENKPLKNREDKTID